MGGVKARRPEHTPQTAARIGRDYPSTRAMGPGQESRDKGENSNPSTYPTVPCQESRANGKTETQTHTPHNSRKSRVHSPDTEVAGAVQALTRPNVTRSAGVRLHPKACAALILEAECATPKHLGAQVPRRCPWYALGTGYARKSHGALGFAPKELPC